VETTVDRDRRETKALVGGGRSPAYFLARPAALLRSEGITMLVGSALLYWLYGGSWWMFALLLLAPDASMLGYLGGPRLGAAAYNAFHSYPLPAALAAFGLLGGFPLAPAVALVWFAHIGMDRTVGYGLKYPTAFGDTHLGRV
jgi:hypothetical protein